MLAVNQEDVTESHPRTTGDCAYDLLVIDDDLVAIELVAAALEGEKFRVHGVTNAQAGLDFIARSKPSIVLLDLVMPGVVGMELLERILEIDPGVDVILFTGNSDQSIRKQVLSNFDAKAFRPSDEFRILIATEVLSEGVNLHRSNVVFNYDIPWNPTRLIQRVGRVNRVDTKFDRIFFQLKRAMILLSSKKQQRRRFTLLSKCSARMRVCLPKAKKSNRTTYSPN